MSWKIRDNKVIDRIRRSIVNDRISHAYIFEGDSNTDKLLFAEDFIKAVLCREAPGDGCDDCVICRKIEHRNHEDIQYIFGNEGTGSVKNEAVTTMQERLKMVPNGNRNIAVISDADKMTARAQNRILKILEEPPGNSVIILLSENINSLLPTVVSRCVYFRIPGDETGYNGARDGKGDKADIEKAVGMIIQGEPFYAIKPLVDEIAKDVEKTRRFLDRFETRLGRLVTDNRYSDRFSPEKIYAAVSEVEEARRDIRSKASKSYVLKKLVLRTGGYE